MKYIWCEDSKSGFFFWQQINKVFFNNKYIVKYSHGIDELTEEIAKVCNDKNQYLVCFDNCTDNEEVRDRVSALRKLEKMSNNIFLVQYICFEQVILSSPEIIRFIPQIDNDPRYSIVRQHIAIDYTDVNELINLCSNANLPKRDYKTTERFFRPILEENAIVNSYRTTRLDESGQRKPYQKMTMCHHYIYKGDWSRCWYDDCTPNCPHEYCWKAQSDCINCKNPIMNYTCSKSESFYNYKRKYEEELHCDRDKKGIPKQQSERIRLLFEDSILKEMLIS